MAPYEEGRGLKSARRVTIATEPSTRHTGGISQPRPRYDHPSSKHCPVYQVSKPKTPIARDHVGNSMDFMNFEEQMSVYTTSLANDFERDLNEAEQRLEHDLDDLTKQLSEECNLLQEVDITLRERLHDEHLDIADPTHPEQIVNISLAQETNTFQTFLDENEKHFTRLWEEWTSVQHELLCLAVEIYGEDAITTKDVEIKEDLQRQITAAISKHEDVLQQYEDAKERLSGPEERMEELCLKTKRSIKAQVKEIRQGESKRSKKWNDAVNDMLKE